MAITFILLQTILMTVDLRKIQEQQDIDHNNIVNTVTEVEVISEAIIR